MAIAYVQTTGKASVSSGNTLPTPAFPANPTIGNYIVVWVFGKNAGGTTIPMTFSDSAGNTYTAPSGSQQQQNSAGSCVAIAYAKVTATGASFTVTVTPARNIQNNINIIAAEFSGIAATSPLDGTPNGNTANFAGSVATPSMTITAGSLVVAAVANSSSSNPENISLSPAGYTVVGSQTNGSTFAAGVAAYQIGPTSPATQTWSDTGGGVYWAAGQFALLAAAAAGGKLFRPGDLSGLGSGGPFFHDPLGGW